MILGPKPKKIWGMNLPLNALRAFEASARHLSFTQAGMELHVSQAAVSAQVKNLEERLGVALFRRLPRGLALTDEGLALLPLLSEGFSKRAGFAKRSRSPAWRRSPWAGSCRDWPHSRASIRSLTCGCSRTTTL
jgi:hypothetical protein